jgi:DNA-binding response OmpR family regulator
MGKPFDNNELVARVEALLRRRSYAAVADRDRRQLRFGVFIIDLGSVQAIHGDAALPLTPTEFKLLKTLGAEPGRVFTRDDLLTGVWGYEPGSDTRLVDVHVGRLRKKLQDGGVTEVAIETARGFGYKLTRASEEAAAS